MRRMWGWFKFTCWQLLFDLPGRGMGMRRVTQQCLRMETGKGFFGCRELICPCLTYPKNHILLLLKHKSKPGSNCFLGKWNWMLQNNFSSSPSPIPHESLFFDSYTQKIPSSIFSNLSLVWWIKVLSPSNSSLAPFVFWLWDLLHSLTLLIPTACCGGISMFSRMIVKDILHHKAQTTRAAEF